MDDTCVNLKKQQQKKKHLSKHKTVPIQWSLQAFRKLKMDIRKWLSPAAAATGTHDPLDLRSQLASPSIRDASSLTAQQANIGRLAQLASQVNLYFFIHWCNWRGLLEYSVKPDAAFCFTCRKYYSAVTCTNVDSAFTIKGYWSLTHVDEAKKGLNKHVMSKEHQMCESIWRERDRRSTRCRKKIWGITPD